MRARHFAHQIGVFERGGTHHRAPHTGFEPAFDIGPAANTATDLNTPTKAGNRPCYPRTIAARPGKGTIEIDDMQHLRSGISEQLCLRARIIGIDRRTVHIAFGEPHALATLEVDGGKDDHANQAFRNASP